MSEDYAELDIITVDSDVDDDGITEIVNSSSCNSHDLIKEASESLANGLVSARTDGIRGRRYLDYQFQPSSGTESGELSDSDVDIVGITENKENELFDNCLSMAISNSKLSSGKKAHETDVACNDVVLDEGAICKEEARFNSISSQKKSNSKVLWNPVEIDVRTDEDVRGILSYIKIEPFDHESNNGLDKLLADHRKIMPIIADSSDDENQYFEISDSESGDDSDYNIPLSVTSEVNRMEGMNIQDHYFVETYPEVEIIDLTLSECEQIIPLGKVYKIVEDFVVVKNCNCDKVLDLDSMIFDNRRKCVGYVFEVLGPVKEPYYSIRFNTNSDIESLGLHIDQELFYSENERYSRYVMVDLLRELEYNSRFRKRPDGAHRSSSDSCNSESESEESSKHLTRPAVGTKRKPKKQLHNRTTSNYSVNYQSVHKQPKHHYNSFTDQLKTVSYVNPAPDQSNFHGMERKLSNSWRNTPNSTHSKESEERKSTNDMSYDTLYNKVKSDQNRKAPTQTQVNSFKSSVLASFLDPFSLDEKDN